MTGYDPAEPVWYVCGGSGADSDNEPVCGSLDDLTSIDLKASRFFAACYGLAEDAALRAIQRPGVRP
jgi:hypothetical protein